MVDENEKPGEFDGVPGGITGRKGKYSLHDRREAQGYDVSAVEGDGLSEPARAVEGGDESIFAGSPPGDPAPTTGVEKFITHKQCDDYLAASGQPKPEVWDTLTVRQKKDYLSAH